jgi:hypothetical protein
MFQTGIGIITRHTIMLGIPAYRYRNIIQVSLNITTTIIMSIIEENRSSTLQFKKFKMQ